MSSLLQTASQWTNDDNTQIKKRVSTMKNTLKRMQPISSQPQTINDSNHEPSQVMNEYYYIQPEQDNSSLLRTSTQENFQDKSSATIEQSQQVVDKRALTINNLLNTIGITGDSAGSNLANFNPPPLGIITRSPIENTSQINPVELFPKVSDSLDKNGYEQQQNTTSFKSYAETNSTGTNYNTIYSQPIADLKNTPYYSKMGIGSGIGGQLGDEKILERLNYMIHLLEQQQNDKTSNVLEETVLYAMLGIFVIFVVDSFSKSGKYIR